MRLAVCYIVLGNCLKKDIKYFAQKVIKNFAQSLPPPICEVLDPLVVLTNNLISTITVLTRDFLSRP